MPHTQLTDGMNVPAWLGRQVVATKVLFVLIGTLVLTASSHVSVPMVPVPMTMQTLAVTLIGALYGWRLGGLTLIVWLGQGAFGLPVFAGGTGGVDRLWGPTGGYLLAFPVAAILAGWLVARGDHGRRVFFAFGAMLAGNAVCLLLGAAWLAGIVGIEKAVAVGMMPFIPGGVLKSAFGALVLKAINSAARRRAFDYRRQ